MKTLLAALALLTLSAAAFASESASTSRVAVAPAVATVSLVKSPRLAAAEVPAEAETEDTAGDAKGAEDSVAHLWRSKCKGCHGVDGKAQTRMGRSHKIQDFTSPAFQQKVSDAQLRKVIENGSRKDPKMKSFKDRLSPEEIGALVRYIRTLGSQR